MHPHEIVDETVIRARANPLGDSGSLAALRGNLCPEGAVMKFAVAEPRLLEHEGPAAVFEDIRDPAARVDDPDLEVTRDSVMCFANPWSGQRPGDARVGTLADPGEAAQASPRCRARG